MVTTNVDAWVKHGTSFFVQHCRQDGTNGYMCTSVEDHLSFAHGAAYLAGVAIVLIAFAGVLSRRLDVN